MKQNGTLAAGAAEVDITPAMGTQLAGDIGRRRPAEALADPIFARALVLDDGEQRLCVLSLEVLGITGEWVERIRQGAAERCGIPAEGVLVHAVQNHAAPSVGHSFFNYEWDCITPELSWLKGGDDAYHEFAVERALEAVEEAARRMRPVRVGLATGLEGRIAFNRRFVLRDGTAVCHPGPSHSEAILHAEGPIDPEVAVVSFTDGALRVVAVLLHYTCHPTHGYPERYVTGGWPGAWARGVKALCGPQCVPLVINGCCGNVHHANHLHPAESPTAERMGEVLTATTRPLLWRPRLLESPTLGVARRIIQIPLREVAQEDLEAARRMLDEHPTPLWRQGMEGVAVEWDWVYALMRLDLERLRGEKPLFDYEVQAFRIGDVAVLGLMGEPFVEGQLRIKMLSPARRTLVAHMSHGYVGYVPTPEALRRGGYETWTSTGSKLAPEALDMIVEASTGVLGELFGR